MATVIDALVVTLGLDLSQYRRGQRDADAAMRHTREEGARTAKDTEARGKQAAQSLGRLRNEMVALFAVVTAGRGLKDFVADITSSDAATGRLAKNLGISVESLAAWRGAAERAGGSAAGIDGTLANLAQQFQQLRLTGQSSVLPYFRSLGVQFTGTERDLFGLARAVQGMNRQEATFKLRGAGLDEGTIQLVLAGEDAIKRFREESGRLAPVNKQATDNAERLRLGLLNLQDGVTGLARELLNALSPALIRAMEGMKAWLIEHRPEIVKAITEGVRDFKDMLARIPWDEIAQGVRNFIVGADGVAQALGGWTRATEILFGLWLGARGLQFVALLTGLAGMKAGGLARLLGPLAAAMTAYAALKAAKPGDWLGDDKDADGKGQSTPDEAAPSPAEQGREFWNRLYKGLTGMEPDPNGTGGAGQQSRAAAQQQAEDTANAISRKAEPERSLLRGVLDRLATWLDQNVGTQFGDTAKAAGEYGTITPTERVRGTGGMAPPTTAEQQASAREARDFFMARGRTQEQAAGIVASLHQESRFDPRAVGDGGSAVGLAQWHPDRVKAILAGTGIDVRTASFQDQLRAVHWEMANTEAGAGAHLARQATAGDAGASVSRRYERPGLTEAARDREAASRAAGAERWNAQWNRERMAAGEPGGPKPILAANPATADRVRDADARAGRPDLYRDPASRPGWFNELPARGAAGAAAGASGVSTHHNDNRSENNVNGPITIHTQATDAQGIASAMGGALRTRAFLPQANSGLA